MIVNPLSQSRRVLGAMAFLSSLVLVFLSNIASSEIITLEAMKWSPLSVPSDAVATKADSSSWSLSKSDSLAVRASVGIDVGDELQPLSARWRIVGDREESGWLQLDSRFDALPGTYTLEFQVVDGYNAPVPRNLELVGGVNYDIPASYMPMLAYKIGAIPPIYARQGDDYQIFIQRTYTSGQRTIREPESPSISGEIDLDAQSGLFRYRPATIDREAFTLRFIERATDQPDVFQDVLVTPVATPARAELDSFHRPKATDRQSDFYLTLTDETIPFDAEEIPFFNGQARPDGLRRVTISGIDVVLDPDTAANSLWEAIHSSTADDNNARITELSIYAERLTIGGTLSVPQTNITIHARELVFQDADGKYASISTKPYTPIQQAGPITPSRTVPMAHHGHKAGDISVLVESILVPGDSPTPRIIADGGDGAPATPGRNGTPGQAVALTGVCASPEYQHIMFVGHWEDPISLPPLADPNNWGHWFNVKPNIMNGENAVIASPPGNGGNSGTITSTLEIAAFASSQGGVAGAVGAATQGGIRWSPGGNPGSGVPVYILRGCINMANHSFTQHWGTNGQDGPAPDASVQVGVSKLPQLEPNKVAWLHPRALTNITLW